MLERDPDRPDTLRCFVDADFEPTTPDKAALLVRIGFDGFRETLVFGEPPDDEGADE